MLSYLNTRPDLVYIQTQLPASKYPTSLKTKVEDIEAHFILF